LFLSEEGEREIALVRVTPCVGLMHSECARFAAFGTGAEGVFCHAIQRVENLVTNFENELALFAEERGRELGFARFFLGSAHGGREHHWGKGIVVNEARDIVSGQV